MPWLAQNSCASEERLLGMEHFQATTAEMRLKVNKVCEKMSSVLLPLLRQGLINESGSSLSLLP